MQTFCPGRSDGFIGCVIDTRTPLVKPHDHLLRWLRLVEVLLLRVVAAHRADDRAGGDRNLAAGPAADQAAEPGAGERRRRSRPSPCRGWTCISVGIDLLDDARANLHFAGPAGPGAAQAASTSSSEAAVSATTRVFMTRLLGEA